MKINKVQITAFGKLKNFELDFGADLNLVYGENEAGKSTVMAFIKMALYGSTVRGTSLENPRVKYLPFDSSVMGGLLYFSHDRVNYRLDCKFGATPAKDKIVLYNDDTGEIINLGAGQTVGEYFFDLSGATFESTAFIQSVTPSGSGDEIAKHLSTSTGANEGTSPELVKKRLSAAKGSQFTPKRVGAGDKIAENIDALNTELLQEKERARILADIKNQVAQKQADIERLKQRKEQLNAVVNMAGNLRRRDQLKNFIDVCERKRELENLCKGIDRALLDTCKKNLWDCNNLQNEAKQDKTKADAALAKAGVKDLSDAVAHLEQSKQRLSQFENRAKQKGSVLRIVLLTLGAILTLGGVAALLFTEIFAYPFVAVGLVLSVLSLIFKRKKTDSEIDPLKIHNDIVDLTYAVEISKQSNSSKQKADEATNAFVADLKKLDQNAEFETAKQTLDRFDSLFQDLQDKTNSFVTLSQALGVSHTDAVKEFEAMPETDVSEKQVMYAKDELGTIEHSITQLVMSVAALNERLSSNTAHKGAAEIEREIAQAKKDLARRTVFAKAADLANEVLADAYSELRQSFGPQLNQKTAELFGKLTQGKYNQIKVSHDLSLTTGQQGSFNLIDAGYLSAGTADQAYIALRLAVAGLLANGSLPIFMDDAFLQFDEQRENLAFKLLSEIATKQQIVFFTCKSDTAARAKQYGANRIDM